MSAETIYCPAQTRPARMYVDPEPAEYCENQVGDYGDLCPEHDEDDRSDELYDAWLDSKYERDINEPDYTDYGE